MNTFYILLFVLPAAFASAALLTSSHYRGYLTGRQVNLFQNMTLIPNGWKKNSSLWQFGRIKLDNLKYSDLSPFIPTNQAKTKARLWHPWDSCLARTCFNLTRVIFWLSIRNWLIKMIKMSVKWNFPLIGVKELEDKFDQDLTWTPRTDRLGSVKTDSLTASEEFLYRNNLKLALF